MVATAPVKSTIYLIHGGWHRPSHYSKVVSALKADGYEVYVPTLPSGNEARPPTADLSTDCELVRKEVTSLVESGKYLVVLMHSYGGMIGSDSLWGLGTDTRIASGPKGGVSQLIYMASMALPEGMSMVDKVREMGHEELMPVAFKFADDQTCMPADAKTQLIGQAVSGTGVEGMKEGEVTRCGADETTVDEYIGSLVRWNGKCMYQPIEHAAWRDIPVSYIHTTEDLTTPYDYQKSIVEKLRSEGREVETYELQTGHSPHLTNTKNVTEIVEKIAGKM